MATVYKTIEEAADDLRMQEPTFLQKTTHGYICPVCNQGANKGQGITRHSSNKELWYCVSCEKARSIFGLYAAHAGLKDDAAHYPEIVKGVAQYYGAEIRDGGSSSGTSTRAQAAKAPEQVKDYTADIEKWHNSLLQDADALGYLHSRGIEDAAIDRFKLGYDKKQNRIIIPRTTGSYSARKISDTDSSPKYLLTGKQALFNAGCLQDIISAEDNAPIVVVEGELDAVAIWQTGHAEVIGLGSITNAGLFVSQAGTYKKKNPGAVYILALDADADGQKAQQKIATGLEQAGILHIAADTAKLYAGAKDAAEAAQKDVDGLINRLVELYDKGCQLRKDFPLQVGNFTLRQASSYLTGGGYDADIEYFRKYRTRKIGYSQIDTHLTLYPGLAVLGGQSSLGKTTFAVNVCDKLLERGETVLFFTLEQLPIEIQTKSIARIIADKNPFTRCENTDIKNGMKSQEIDEARKKYAELSKNCYYITGDFRTTAADIVQCVETFMKMNPDIKPIVIIDYLQLIAAPDKFKGGIRECVDENLKALKDMQKRNELFVIVISSFNRSSNLLPVSYESFKETSMIEYTCDYVWGLQLSVLDAENSDFYTVTGVKGGKSPRTDDSKRDIINKAQEAIPKKVEFVSLKSRNGRQFYKAFFDYFPANDRYTETDSRGYNAVNYDSLPEF